jgi:hypothetical protein
MRANQENSMTYFNWSWTTLIFRITIITIALGFFSTLIASPAPYIDDWPPAVENGFKPAVKKCMTAPWDTIHFRYLGEDGKIYYYSAACQRVLAIAKLREKIET